MSNTVDETFKFMSKISEKCHKDLPIQVIYLYFFRLFELFELFELFDLSSIYPICSSRSNCFEMFRVIQFALGKFRNGKSKI